MSATLARFAGLEYSISVAWQEMVMGERAIPSESSCCG